MKNKWGLKILNCVSSPQSPFSWRHSSAHMISYPKLLPPLEFPCGSAETNLTGIHKALLRGSGIQCCRGVGCRCGWDPVFQWLWCRPVAVAPIWRLAWEFSYAVGGDLKKKPKNFTSLLHPTSPSFPWGKEERPLLAQMCFSFFISPKSSCKNSTSLYLCFCLFPKDQFSFFLWLSQVKSSQLQI